jgi:DNA-binding MarR family transcriptional regulator
MSDAAANRLGALALALTDAQTAAVRRAGGLGPAATAALVALGVDPGAPIAELARVAGLTHSVMVRAVEGLVADGLVARGAAADRRRAALTLTQAGAARRDALLTARRAVLDRARAALAPEAAAGFDAAVDAMLAALTDGRDGADRLCRLCDEAACGPACPVEAAAVRSAGPAS